MKSGCRAEESRLQTAERIGEVPRPRYGGQLAHLLSSPCRPASNPKHRPTLSSPPSEINALDSIDAARPKPRLRRRALADYLLQIAMLGGYLARSRDPPPGNMVLWRGITRLHDIAVGITIGAERRCG